MKHDLLVRPATAADKPAVLAFCASTWDGGDYIQEVWDDWLAYPFSDLLVCEIDGKVVGLVHVTVEDGAGWLEGLRVAREVRGRGLAHAMLRGGIAAARARGAEALRLLTERGNTAMARLLPQHGFEDCFTAAWYSAPARDSDDPIGITPDHVDAARAALDHAPLLDETGGLYADGWNFMPWTARRFQQHVHRGEVVRVQGVGYAVLMPDGESEQPAIALATGDDMERLLSALRSHPAACAHGDVRIFLPVDGPLAQTAQRAGYAPRPHRFGIWTLGL